MSLEFVRTLLLGWALACVGTFAHGAPAPSPVALDDTLHVHEIAGEARFWLEQGNAATAQAANAQIELFKPFSPTEVQPLSANTTLWLLLKVERKAAQEFSWTLEVPLPYIDEVSVFVSDGLGGWTQQQAGSALPRSAWSRNWLYPAFIIDTPGKSSRDVLIRIRNADGVSVPVRIGSLGDTGRSQMTEVALMGVVLGLLLSLSALSIFRYLLHRNLADIGAAVFGGVITLTIAQVNGLLPMMLWPEAIGFSRVSFALFPLIALGGFLQFLRMLYQFSARYRRYDKFMKYSAWGTLLCCLGFLVLPLKFANQLAGTGMFFATLVAIAATGLYARAGSKIARWMLIVLAPQLMVVLWLSAEQANLVPNVWELRYVMTVLLAVSVPFLTFCLHVATHDRNELLHRADLLPVQDALTGLLNRTAFVDLGKQAFQRVMSNGEPVAMVMIEIVNHEHLRQTFGNQIAEQSVLRSVIKLHRVLRDVDQAGRVDTAKFALLMDGVASRDQLSERIVKLIASGLIPLPGLQPAITLQFHAACLILHEHPLEPERALDELESLLAEIKPRTRRPIRFVEPASTQVIGLSDDAELA